MELSALRIFATVVREGGVTRAAERLGRVQSNVTTRVRQLEDDLGVELFARRCKRLHLAPAGEVLLDYAERILALAEEARAAVHGEAPRGVFKLGAMESTAAVRLPQPLAAFAARYPAVKLELQTGNPSVLQAALLAGEIEAALIAEPVAAAQFDSMLAFEEEAVVVTAAGHPAIAEGGALPDTIIVFEHGCPHRRRLEQWYAATGQVPRRTIELASYHAMLGCVLAGMGGAMLPLSVLTTFPAARDLRVHRPPSGLLTPLRTMLVWRKGAPSPRVKALAAILAPAVLMNQGAREDQEAGEKTE